MVIHVIGRICPALAGYVNERTLSAGENCINTFQFNRSYLLVCRLDYLFYVHETNLLIPGLGRFFVSPSPFFASYLWYKI